MVPSGPFLRPREQGAQEGRGAVLRPLLAIDATPVTGKPSAKTHPCFQSKGRKGRPCAPCSPCSPYSGHFSGLSQAQKGGVAFESFTGLIRSFFFARFTVPQACPASSANF